MGPMLTGERFRSLASSRSPTGWNPPRALYDLASTGHSSHAFRRFDTLRIPGPTQPGIQALLP
jgi:hypothetical protein